MVTRPIFTPLTLRLFDGPHFQQFQAEGPQAIEDALEGSLVDLLGSQSGMACLHDDVELLKSGDDGRDRLTIEGDLICPQRHHATSQGWSSDAVIPLSMRAAVAPVVTSIG